MLDETIASAQHNNSESLLALIEKFKPLLKKYAYKLHYEDAYYDLQLDFIQIILTINLDAALSTPLRLLLRFFSLEKTLYYTNGGYKSA